MYQKIDHTDYPPLQKPIVVWDGDCAFCEYWANKGASITGLSVDYEPYQSAADNFMDIPLERFQEAVRLIEPDGTVFSGAEAALRVLTYGKRWSFLYDWYVELPAFRDLADLGYQYSVEHRTWLLYASHILLGRDPRRVVPNWLFILVGLLAALIVWKLVSSRPGTEEEGEGAEEPA